MKIRDNSKCREWERRRRDRLTDAFKALVELLPNYDPSKLPARIDVLENATQFIKELRLSNSRLVADQTQPAEMIKKIKALQDEVNKLVLRVKQLTSLLVKARISIPNGPSIKSLGKKSKKWSNKLTIQDIENTIFPQHSKSQQSIHLENQADAQNTCKNSGKTTITVVDKIGDEVPLMKKPIKVVETVLPPKTEAPATTQQTFVLTPIQLQPQLFTRINLAASLQQPHSILSKVVLQSSSLQKIPIKSITKRVPKKLRKTRASVKRNTKTVSHKQECETQTTQTETVANVQYDSSVISSPTKNTDTGTENLSIQNNDIVNLNSSHHSLTNQTPKDNVTNVSAKFLKKCNAEVNMPEETQQTSLSKFMEVHAEKSADPADFIVTQLDDQITVSQQLTTEISSKLRKLDDAPGNNENDIFLKASDESKEAPPCVASQVVNDDSATLLSEKGTSRKLINNGIISTLASVSTPNQVSNNCSHISNNTTITSSSAGVTRIEDFDMEESGRDSLPLPVPETSEPISLDTEKISECIARSIGLMEGGCEETEAELLELETDWGDVVGGSHSPKSPISPTQMFLSMFPLLPRESLTSVPAETQVAHVQTSSSLAQPSKSCRSSFFIDSMLPEENQNNVTRLVSFEHCEPKSKRFVGDGDSLDTILAPLQPLTRERGHSELLSLSAFLQSSDEYEIEPLDRIKDKGVDKSLISSNALPRSIKTIPNQNFQTVSISTSGSGSQNLFHQNVNVVQEHSMPTYHQKSREIPSNTYFQHSYTDPPNTSGSCFEDNTHSFRHHYIETGLDSENSSSTHRSSDNQSHQKKEVPPPQKRINSKSELNQTESILSQNFNTGQNRTTTKPQARNTQSTNSLVVPYFSHQGSKPKESKTKTVDKRQKDATNFSNSSSTVHLETQNFQPISAPLQQHIYTSSNFSPASNAPIGIVAQTDQAPYFSDRSSRSYYCPTQTTRLTKDTPPFYLGSHRHALQPNGQVSSQGTTTGARQSGQHPPHKNYYQSHHTSIQSQDKIQTLPPYYSSPTVHTIDNKQCQTFVQPIPSSQYTQMGMASDSHLNQSNNIPQPLPLEHSVPNKNFLPPASNQSRQHPPVNWMTDSPYKKGSTFSVSKLVDGQSTNYGDAVIRRNRNPWNDIYFRQNHQPCSSTVGPLANSTSTHNPYQHTGGHVQSDSFVQPETYEQLPQHHRHHDQTQNYFNSHQQGPISNSISNFNLSSIFPEINDKSQQQQQQPGKEACQNY